MRLSEATPISPRNYLSIYCAVCFISCPGTPGQSCKVLENIVYSFVRIDHRFSVTSIEGCVYTVSSRGPMGNICTKVNVRVKRVNGKGTDVRIYLLDLLANNVCKSQQADIFMCKT